MVLRYLKKEVMKTTCTNASSFHAYLLTYISVYCWKFLVSYQKWYNCTIDEFYFLVYIKTFLPFILWDLWHGFSTSMIPIFLKKPFFATEALLHYFLLRLHKMIKFCNCSQKKRGNLLVKSIPVLISEYISLFGIAICIFLSVYMIIFNWCTIRESHVYISLDLTKYHSISISRKIKHILMHLAID